MYIQDYDEKFPLLVQPYAGAHLWWFQILHPYIKNKQVFVCPSESYTSIGYPLNPAYGDSANNMYEDSTWSRSDSVHYTPNNNLMHVSITSEAAIQSQSNMFMMWDSEGPYGAAAYAQEYPGYNRDRPGLGQTNGYLPKWARHMEGDSYLFVDGHAKWLHRSGVPETDPRFNIQ
jgi:prepilin-type processing-associated H-X9-DG protein